MLIDSTVDGFKLTDKIGSVQISENNEPKSIIETCEVFIFKDNILYNEMEHIVREYTMI